MCERVVARERERERMSETEHFQIYNIILYDDFNVYKNNIRIENM